MKVKILLVTFTIFSSLVNGLSVQNYRRFPGGAISPGRHGRTTMEFSKDPYSISFHPSRELTGQGMHSHVNHFQNFRPMNANGFTHNKATNNGRGFFNNFGGSNSFAASQNFGTNNNLGTSNNFRASNFRANNNFGVNNNIRNNNGNGYKPTLGTTKRNIGGGYNTNFGSNGQTSFNNDVKTMMLNYDVGRPNLPNEYESNNFGGSNGFSSSIDFGSQLPNVFDNYNNIGLGGYASSNSHSESSYDQQPIIQKNIYVHVPPPELEEPSYPSHPPMPVSRPEKQYKIIFIKAPSPPAPQQPILPAQPSREEKTLVYVLVKKPEEPAPPVYSLPEPTKPSKPEVFFIRYKASKDEGGYPESSQNPGTNYGVPGYGNSGHSLYGQGSSLRPLYLPPNQYPVINKKSF